jgi:hypothetical protein
MCRRPAAAFDRTLRLAIGTAAVQGRFAAIENIIALKRRWRRNVGDFGARGFARGIFSGRL